MRWLEMPGYVKLSYIFDITWKLRFSEIYPLVLHAFDVAKISALVYKKIFGNNEARKMYLTGFFHDIGLIPFYAHKVSQSSSSKMVNLIFKAGFKSFNLDNIIKMDNDIIHPKISAAMAKK